MVKDGSTERLQIVAERLKEIRIASGYTSYEKFALEIEMQPKQYWRLEDGRDFKMSTLIRILEFYEMSFDDFFKDLK